jgi:hypothetical protein
MLQVASALERTSRRGNKRLRLNKSMRVQERKAARKGVAAPPQSVELLQQRGRQQSVPRGGSGAEACLAPGSDGAGVAVRGDAEMQGTADEAAMPAAGSSTGEISVAAAQPETAGEGTAPIVRRKTVATGPLPTPLPPQKPAAGGDQQAEPEVATSEAQSLADLATPATLLHGHVRVVFRGYARQQAASLLTPEARITPDAAHDTDMVAPSASAVPSEAGAAMQSAGAAADEDESDAPEGMERLPGAADSGADSGAPGMRSARIAANKPSGLRRHRLAVEPPGAGPVVPQPQAMGSAGLVQAGSAEERHKRNVMHMLAPPLLADSGLGPMAVPSAAAAHTSARGDLPAQQPALATAQQPRDSVLAFLQELCASADDGTAQLRVSIIELAHRLLPELCARTARRSLPHLLAAAVRLDAAAHATLTPECHLLLAELCVERAVDEGIASKQDSVQGRAGGTGAGAGRGSGRSSADADRAANEATALRKRCEEHLVRFQSLCIACGSLSEAAAASLELGPEHVDAQGAQQRACQWALRASWSAHRAAWERGDVAGALEELAACERICAATASDGRAGDTALGMPWCPLAPIISAAAISAAERRLRVHDTLQNLERELRQWGHRAVCARLAESMLADPSAARAMFAMPREYMAALSQLLAVVMEPAAPTPAEAAADAPGAETNACDAPAAAALAAATNDNAASTSAAALQITALPPDHDVSAVGAAQGSNLAESVGDLSPQETLWLRVTLATHFASALLPLERTIANALHLASNGVIPVQAVLVRSDVSGTGRCLLLETDEGS